MGTSVRLARLLHLSNLQTHFNSRPNTSVTDSGCRSSSCRDSGPTRGQACTSGSTRASYLILLTRPSLILHQLSTTYTDPRDYDFREPQQQRLRLRNRE